MPAGGQTGQAMPILMQDQHGCVNTPPSVMKTVYNNLSTHEPVVIY